MHIKVHNHVHKWSSNCYDQLPDLWLTTFGPTLALSDSVIILNMHEFYCGLFKATWMQFVVRLSFNAPRIDVRSYSAMIQSYSYTRIVKSTITNRLTHPKKLWRIPATLRRQIALVITFHCRGLKGVHSFKNVCFMTQVLFVCAQLQNECKAVLQMVFS